MAEDARLEKAGLVVERRSSRCAAEAGGGMALEAEEVDVAQLQHVGIGTTVDQVA